MFCVRARQRSNTAHSITDDSSCGLEGTLETDLHFWELHRPGPYLVVQSQYVLVNKRALRGRKNNSKAHRVTAPEAKHTAHVSLKTK